MKANKNFKIVLSFTAAIIFSLTLFSCKSTENENLEELTSSQLIQRGQDAYDTGHYKNALSYFEAALTYYGTDPKCYIEATYEIGHLYMNTKKYENAYNCFVEILDLFENSTTEADLPTSYKVLAQIELDKITPAEMEKIQAKLKAQEDDLANEAEKVAKEEAAREEAKAAVEKAAQEKIQRETEKAEEERKRLEENLAKETETSSETTSAENETASSVEVEAESASEPEISGGNQETVSEE